MKTLIVFLTILWFGLTALNNSVKADEYNTAVIGHVISETIRGTDMDHQKLLETEMSKMAYTFALQMTAVLEKHLPYIMDNVMTQLRLELDKTHKCQLLKGSKIEDEECKTQSKK